MKRYTADLHIHSCLSPCAELDMTPKRIIEKAIEKGLDVIAISDHNSAENLEVAENIARRRGIALLHSLEATSAEEVHVLAILETLGDALSLQDILYEAMPPGINDERYWGSQLVVDEDDVVLGFNRRLLMGASGLALKELVDKIHALGGLAVASHADRESFGVFGQLGFIPADVRFDAIEVTRPEGPEDFLEKCGGAPCIMSSDAHRLSDIGRRTTTLILECPSFKELSMALRAEGGRGVAGP